MDLAGTSLMWRGLTVTGSHSSRHQLLSLDGWEDLPLVRDVSARRPDGHGRFSGAHWAEERIVVVTGSHVVLDQRDQILAELHDVMALTGSALSEPLTIEHAGRSLTADAQLTRFQIRNTAAWGTGHFTWAAEWRCPDPLRYGEVVSATTGFPVAVGGLEYPLYTDGTDTTGWLDYGEASTTGRVTLTNPGTADTWPQFQIAGPVPAAGFDIVAVGSGRRLRFEGAVPSGSALVLDAATGTAVIDGVADRGGLLTWRDWTPVPARGSAEFAFIPLGASSAAVLTASARPAYW